MSETAANEEGGDGHHRRTYVLTFDLPQKVKLFESVGLKVPDPQDEFFPRVRAKLVEMVQAAFPDAEIRNISMDDLANEIWSQAKAEIDLAKNSVVVSTCYEISNLKQDLPMKINRIYDQSGNFLGLGPRPGSLDLADQVEAIYHSSSGRAVILVEDGTFTGGTMVKVLKLLQERRMEIAAIIVGFLFPAGERELRKEFSGKIINIEHISKIIDWMPDHDFFPFIPNCGRVLGVSWNGNITPLYTREGMSISVPYLVPFCPPEMWALWTGIDQGQAIRFSTYFLDRTLELFDKMMKLNGRPIKIKDLQGVNPWSSIPVALGDQQFPNPDQRIVDYLIGYRQELD